MNDTGFVGDNKIFHDATTTVECLDRRGVKAPEKQCNCCNTNWNDPIDGFVYLNHVSPYDAYYMLSCCFVTRWDGWSCSGKILG